MKKNPGRKMRREQHRKDLADMKEQMRIASKPLKENKVTPHENAIKANENREKVEDNIISAWESFKEFFKGINTVSKEQIAKMERRNKWLKAKGLK